MPKSRKKRSVARKARPRIAARKIAPLMIKSTLAFILLLIAQIILIINAIFAIFWGNWIIDTLKTMPSVVLWGKTIDLIVPTQLQLIQTGIAFAFLAMLSFLAYARIMKGQKVWIWFLVILAAFALFMGRLDSGILMLISAWIYLSKFKKLKKI